jgi:hypothetical protein
MKTSEYKIKWLLKQMKFLYKVYISLEEQSEKFSQRHTIIIISIQRRETLL